MEADAPKLVKGRILYFLPALEGSAMPRSEVIDRGAMVVSKGVVEWLGPQSEAPGDLPTQDFGERLITPGLVDAHAHPIFGGNRANEFERRSKGDTYEQIAAEGGGIQSSVRATRAATEDELVEVGKKHAQWFLSNGTTTVEAKSGYGLSLEHEMKMLRAAKRLSNGESPMWFIPTLLAAHAYPPEFQDDHQGYIDLICDTILPTVRKEQLARFVDIFCEEKYFDHAATERILLRAKELGYWLRIHADQLTNNGGAKLAAKLGVWTADHLEQADEEGIQALKAARVKPVLLPASVFALGLKKYPDARRMIDEGLCVVLASDFNPGSSPTASLPFVMSLACTQMGMTPDEAFAACSINGAQALNVGAAPDTNTVHADIGDLKPRQLTNIKTKPYANFVVWDCEQVREIPYWIGAPLVYKTFIRGKEVFSRT